MCHAAAKGNNLSLLLYVKRLHSNLNIISLVAVKKKEKVGKIGKIEIKRIDKNKKKESFQPAC